MTYRAQYGPRKDALSGTFSVTVSSASDGTGTISFASGYFPTAPRVIAVTNGGFWNWFASVDSVTTSGATIHVAERNSVAGSGSVTGYWIAVAQ